MRPRVDGHLRFKRRAHKTQEGFGPRIRRAIHFSGSIDDLAIGLTFPGDWGAATERRRLDAVIVTWKSSRGRKNYSRESAGA